MGNVFDSFRPEGSLTGGSEHSVSTAGDIDGDDYDEVVIGANGTNNDAGAAYILFGDFLAGLKGGVSNVLNVTNLVGGQGIQINGLAANAIAGTSVAGAGDVDGDDLADLLIGSHGSTPNGAVSGEAILLFGSHISDLKTSLTASVNVAELAGGQAIRFKGIDAYDYAGTSVSFAGKIDEDLHDEILIAAPGAQAGAFKSGETYLLYGDFLTNLKNSSILDFQLSTLNGTSGLILQGVGSVDYSGTSLAQAGDVDSQGRNDILIGAPNRDPGGDGDAGTAYLIFGEYLQTIKSTQVSELNLASLDGTNGVEFRGIDADDFFGRSVSSARDINLDGYSDIFIGAYGADPDNLNRAGEAYLISGYSIHQAAQGNGVSTAGVIDLSVDFGWGSGSSNSSPTFGSATTSTSVPENTSGAFYTAEATDADSDPLTYSVVGGADGDKFEFDGTGLKFKSAPDFENPTDVSTPPDNVYEVQIQASDGNGGTAMQTASVTVTDVAEPNIISHFTSSTYSYGVNAVSDLDTDGMDELMIHRSGSSFVLEDSLLYGQQAIDLDTLNSDQALLITGFNTNRERDLTAAFIGDFNSDGIGDVVLGKHDSSMGGISYNGRMYFLSGASLVSQSGTISADTAVQNGGMTIYGEKFGDYLGWTINAISDSRSGEVKTSVFSASSERSVTVAASVNKGGLDEFSTADLSGVYAASGQGASINIGTLADYREEISGISVGNGFPGRGFPVGDLNQDNVEDLMLLPRWAYQETAFVSGAELLDGNSISLNNLSAGQGYIISNSGFSPIGSFSIAQINSDNFADAVIYTNNSDDGSGITGGTIFILKSGDFFVNESTPAQWSSEGNIKLSSTQGIYLANATELPDISGDGVSEIAFGTNSNTTADKLGIYIIYSEFLSTAAGDYSLEDLTADQLSFVPTSQALVDLEAGNFDTDSGPELAVTTHDGGNVYILNTDNFGSWNEGDLF